MQKLMVLDGNSIINRAFYGVRPLNTKDGTPTNAVYGFLSILQKLLADENPDGICVAFDVKGPTFRHEQYEGYKAQRKPMPDELRIQMPILKEVLDALNIARYELEGFEADDLIGTIARICDENKQECVIVTGDKDDLQLVTKYVRVKLVTSRMGQTKTEDYTPEKVQEVYGFSPKAMIDFKALMGDPSDNIPGVAGVGEKTASDLITRFGSIDKIYENLAELDIKDTVRKKLETGREQAKLSYQLATIVCDVSFGFSLEDTTGKAANAEVLRALFLRLEFTRFLNKFGLDASSTMPLEEAKAAPSVAVVQIQTEDELSKLLTNLKQADFVAVRLLENLDAVEIGQAEDVCVVAWNQVGESYHFFLRELFGPDVKKVGHHIKDSMRQLLHEGIYAENYIFDTALAAYLLEPTKSEYLLDEIASQYLSEPTSEGANNLYQLYPILEKQLETNGLKALFDEIELPLCAVLAEMEYTGIFIDKQALSVFGTMLSGRILQVQAEIYELAGREFNISSPKQLGQVLFEGLALPPSKKTKTGYSTNVEVLEKLKFQHPIIAKIMDYREWTKLKSTYVDGLAKEIGTDGRIHSHFQMTVTATGRLSSTEPNLQNIPVRKELGQEIRKMFIAPAGQVLVDADYSQIELRLLAHISEDKRMIEAFAKEEDIHTVTASQVFDVPQSEVTAEMRSGAKAVNFGIVYGISAFSLADDIGVSNAEAKQYIENYLTNYSGVASYMKNVVQQAKDTGEVRTIYGRKRAMPELSSSNFNLRAFGERVALNMPIQGTAADVIKLAMIRVATRLKEEKLAAKLILQVHDELIVQCPEEEGEHVRKLLESEMEQVASLSVPLKAEAKIGKSWHDSK